jgi:aryl-alcohol dehydrogenase-like predicted oxidoreductase
LLIIHLKKIYRGGTVVQYRKFGRTGWKVSEIGFGAWAIGGGWGAQEDAESVKTLHKALDLGVNFIDTAQGYGNGKSEEIIGKTLRERGGLENVYIATKIPPKPGPWPPSPYCRIGDRFPGDYLRERTELSLKTVGRDYIDVMQLHTWTRAWNEEAGWLETLRALKEEGKIRAIGISTPEVDQDALNELIRSEALDSVQVIFNIFEQKPAAQMFPLAKRHDCAVIVRVPFDESALTGKLTEDTTFPPDDFRSRYFKGERLTETLKHVDEVRQVVGDHYEGSLVRAALRFCLEPEAVSTVIPGMRKVYQAEDNCAVSDLGPMPEVLYEKLKKQYWEKSFQYV